MYEVQRHVEFHDLGRYEHFEYSVHQWIQNCHVTRNRCSCDWYLHGVVVMLKIGMMLFYYQPSIGHLRLLVHTLEGMSW